MRRPDCRNELAARARRQTLSAADQAVLDEHLSVCRTCQFDRRIGADFDEIAGLPPGYEDIEARLADAVLERLEPARRSPARRALPWLRAAVVASLVIGTAAAASVFVRLRALPPLRSAPVAATIEPRACGSAGRASCDEPETNGASPSSAREPVVAAIASTPDSAASSSQPVDVRSVIGPAVRASPHHGKPPQAADQGASSLFEKATLERQQRHAAAAIALYGDLERRYPASEEARIAHVSLGRLLLDHGMPSEAVEQFREYLKAPGDALLAPEALFGKARALEATGRRDESRETWRQLLAGFPTSVYATEARQRLEASR